jgi:hypothetical protein
MEDPIGNLHKIDRLTDVVYIATCEIMSSGKKAKGSRSESVRIVV